MFSLLEAMQSIGSEFNNWSEVENGIEIELFHQENYHLVQNFPLNGFFGKINCTSSSRSFGKSNK